MADAEYKVVGMTQAVVRMEEMLNFYSKVFDIQFSEMEMHGHKLYSGAWGDLKILFCPAELAGNKAVQNRHQFDIIVPSLELTADIVNNNGGELMGEIVEDEYFRSLGVYDPDKNTLVFKEVLKH